MQLNNAVQRYCISAVTAIQLNTYVKLVPQYHQSIRKISTHIANNLQTFANQFSEFANHYHIIFAKFYSFFCQLPD